ncbi:Rrf2 family transcriptional regulator [Kozakia baliensis]|uniref:RrF2 family transcriptional regulator n=1 Tax=Kozakia baliensis TaxID=153496 RepID=UPI00345BFD3B
MRLTLHTDYALRTLLFLGMNRDRRVSIREIAEAYKISENHLIKVVHRLGQGGFIETLRGRGGGLRLGKEPKEIRVGDVVRFTEEDMALVACFQNGQNCMLTGACRLQGVLGEALGAFMSVLDDKTLADLLTPPERAALAARFALHSE